jgi:hypothetical protein
VVEGQESMRAEYMNQDYKNNVEKSNALSVAVMASALRQQSSL